MAILESTGSDKDELSFETNYAISEDPSDPTWNEGWQKYQSGTNKGEIAWTKRNSNDGDNNAYYLGYMPYEGETIRYFWWSRFRFKIPSSAGAMTIPKKIEITIKCPSDQFIVPTRAFLSDYSNDNNSKPSHYFDKNSTTKITPISEAWLSNNNNSVYSTYQKITKNTLSKFTFTNFNKNLQSDTYYYIYIMGYQTTSSAMEDYVFDDYSGNGFNGSYFNGDNLPSSPQTDNGYTTIKYTYDSLTIKIQTSSGKKDAIPYVYHNNAWRQAIPKIYNGTNSTWR